MRKTNKTLATTEEVVSMLQTQSSKGDTLVVRFNNYYGSTMYAIEGINNRCARPGEVVFQGNYNEARTVLNYFRTNN